MNINYWNETETVSTAEKYEEDIAGYNDGGQREKWISDQNKDDG